MGLHHDEVEQEIEAWFFDKYIPHWMSVGSGRSKEGPEFILEYWGTPMFASGTGWINRWLMTDDDVVEFLKYNHEALKGSDYHHTVVPDKRVHVYNDNSASIEVIWSRRKEDETELERVAVNFLCARVDGKWKALGIVGRDTTKDTLEEAWEEELLDTSANLRAESM